MPAGALASNVCLPAAGQRTCREPAGVVPAGPREVSATYQVPGRTAMSVTLPLRPLMAPTFLAEPLARSTL